MKTTLEIDDPILTKAKKLARARGLTLRQLVQKALIRELQTHESSSAEKTFRPLIHKGRGLRDEFLHASWPEIRQAIYDTHTR